MKDRTEGRFDDFADAVGKGAGHLQLIRPALSESNREERLPLPVAQLLAGEGESIPLPKRRILRVSKIKVKRKKKIRKTV